MQTVRGAAEVGWFFFSQGDWIDSPENCGSLVHPDLRKTYDIIFHCVPEERLENELDVGIVNWVSDLLNDCLGCWTSGWWKIPIGFLQDSRLSSVFYNVFILIKLANDIKLKIEKLSETEQNLKHPVRLKQRWIFKIKCHWNDCDLCKNKNV